MKFKVSLSDVLGFGLFGITALYSIEYFAKGTATVFDAWKAGAMAFFFEGAKIILWRRGWDTKNILFVIVSIPFFCISFISAGGSSMIYLAKSTNTVASVSASNLQTQLDQTDAQITLLQKRLAAVADDPNAPTVSLRKELGDAMTTRATLGKEQEGNKTESATNVEGADMIMDTLSKAVGMQKTRFELLFMLARAILLELGAMASTTPIGKNKRQKDVPEFRRSVRLPIGHAIKKDGTTYCGIALEDSVPITKNTPICGACITEWKAS